MRHTTRTAPIALLAFLASCVGTVGDDPGSSRPRPTNDNDPPPPGCEEPTEVTTPITIRSDADFAAHVPDGCWDLFAKLRIEGPNISSLAKLGKLKGVNDLEIVDTKLASIDTELPLAVYGAVTITGNKQLASLANLPIDNADNLTTSYTVRGNTVLTSLAGLEYMQAVEGDLRIADNPQLGDITLDELVSVAGSLTIANTAASRIDLGSLQEVHDIEIANNAKLTALDGIATSVVAGDLVLRANPQLQTLGAVGSIQRVEGSLQIVGNTALKDLTAFSGLQYITSSLAIDSNTTLASLGRLSRLSAVGGTVSITGNSALPYCSGHEVEHCLTNRGAVTLANNQPQNAACTCWCAQQ